MQKVPFYARNLRFLRQIRGDTQKDIANFLEKTSSETIGHIEAGRNGMSVFDMMKLCDYYKISETDFCRGELWRMTDVEIEELKRKWTEVQPHSIHIIM